MTETRQIPFVRAVSLKSLPCRFFVVFFFNQIQIHFSSSIFIINQNIKKLMSNPKIVFFSTNKDRYCICL